MSLTIIATDAGGTRAFVRDATGPHINWTENIAEAQQFADATAANAFLSGKTGLVTKLLTVAGTTNYGHKTHV